MQSFLITLIHSSSDWAFNLPRGEPCRVKWRQIPADTDVLLTHGPPFSQGDKCESGIRAGCEDLLDEITKRIIPKESI